MRICCAGEVMVELAAEKQAGTYRRGVAGDSFNTAVYLARAGLQVDYLTRLGDDNCSSDILKIMKAENLGTDWVQCCENRQTGLYMIDNTESGERQFTYWRDRSPARELFDQPLALPRYDAFYFTGITLAVTQTGLANLVTGLGKLKSDGCRIIFDSNYRPGLWADHALAQEHYRAVLPLCDMVLPSLEDEIALWGHHSIQACRQMYQGFGVRELVIKGHGLTAHAFSDQGEIEQQAQAVDAIDTTGAGDSFNAGYLATRLRNGSIRDSLNAAQQLSAAVVQHRGAILPLLHTATTGTH